MNRSKRLLAVMTVTVLFAVLSVIPAFAAYPVSVELGIPAPADAQILNGELIGTLGWGDSEDVDYRAAFDGDVETFFDPLGVGEENYAGMKLDQQYTLVEVRIHPRTNFLDRFDGATIQGSNDGNTWTDLWESMDVAADVEFQIIKADQLKNNIGYSYYRYVNNLNHGDVGEVEFWAAVPQAAEPEPEPEPVVESASAAIEAPQPVVEAPVAAVVTAPAPVSAPKTGSTGVAVALAILAAVVFAATKAIQRKK